MEIFDCFISANESSYSLLAFSYLFYFISKGIRFLESNHKKPSNTSKFSIFLLICQVECSLTFLSDLGSLLLINARLLITSKNPTSAEIIARAKNPNN
jgi:hypothetical protein